MSTPNGFVDLLGEAVRTILTCQVRAGLDLRGIPLLSKEGEARNWKRTEAEIHYVPGLQGRIILFGGTQELLA